MMTSTEFPLSDVTSVTFVVFFNNDMFLIARSAWNGAEIWLMPFLFTNVKIAFYSYLLIQDIKQTKPFKLLLVCCYIRRQTNVSENNFKSSDMFLVNYMHMLTPYLFLFG